MTFQHILKKKKTVIAVIALVLIALALGNFYHVGKPKIEIIEGGATVRGKSRNKIIDSDLGIELAYPPEFNLTIEREGTNGLHLYRQIGFGERLHCNESGKLRPHILSDPDLYLEVHDQRFTEYLSEIGYDSLEKWIRDGGEVKIFNDGRKYYEWTHGVEMCDSRITIIPIDDGRLVLFHEPIITDINPAITEQGQQTLEELLAGRKQFAYWDRDKIFVSIQSLAPDPAKAKRNELISEFKPQDDSFESREQAQALGMTPREFYLSLSEDAHSNPFPKAVVYDQEIKLLTYPLEWNMGSRYIFEVWVNGQSLLKEEPGGAVWPQFVDIDKDGVSEISIGFDGGGNTSYCLQSLYRWERLTEREMKPVAINFIRNEKVYSQPYESSPIIECSGDEGGLKYENRKAFYITTEWKQVTDPRLDSQLQKCDKEEVRYEYDGKDFRETSRTILLADVSMDGWGRAPSCYMPADPPWLN